MTTQIALGILITLLFVALLTVFCMVLIKLYTNKIKTYTKLIYEKEIESQKAVNDAIIETQEQTLNNISQELHDDAGQQLTYINFQIENLKLDSPEMETVLSPLSESLSLLSQSVRSISHSLNNQLLLQQDLIKAIEAEATRLQKSNILQIEFKASGSTEKFFTNTEKIIIFRIFQEMINNCLKHSKATSVAIGIQKQPFRLTVTDNGTGFDPSHAGQNSLGLTGMAKRAEVINYTLDIESASGKGTRITLTEK